MSSPAAYRAELDLAVRVAREAGALILPFYLDGAKTWEKSENNPVTEADLAADRHIRAAISRAYPDDGLLSEETEDDLGRLGRSRVWIVDPIDGTREFTRQVPEFAVSIGLAVEGVPVLGVVYNPACETLVAGSIGNGVTKNASAATVSRCTRLEDARVIASRSEEKDGRLDPYEGRFGSLTPTGSIAWKLARVACGDADFNLSLKPKHEWDVCAGDFLVHEAGGAYVDFEGTRLAYNQRDPVNEAPMIAGPCALVDAFRAREAQAR